MLDALLFVLGTVAILTVLLDVFFIVAPRASRFGLSWSHIVGTLAWPIWLDIGRRLSPARRHSFLSAFAPSFLFVYLIFWLVLLVFGYGCIFFALREHLRPVSSFGSSVYFAGTSLLTIGYGDIVPIDPISRGIAVLAGATGVGVFSVTTAFLFTIFSAFQTRERYVLFLGLRGARPSSGIALVEMYARAGALDQLAATLRVGQEWIASVVETHVAYPTLLFFRTNDPNLSWLGTMVTLLDASTLLATTVRNARALEADFTIELGRHAAETFTRYLKIPRIAYAPMDRLTFDRGFARLRASGADLYDSNEAWVRFNEIRSSYIRPLAAIGSYLAAPHGEWFQTDRETDLQRSVQ